MFFCLFKNKIEKLSTHYFFLDFSVFGVFFECLKVNLGCGNNENYICMNSGQWLSSIRETFQRFFNFGLNDCASDKFCELFYQNLYPQFIFLFFFF